VAARISLALLLLSALAIAWFGIERSLWMDEAWVVNSARASSLREMFYYPGWLQTSPPLFLLLERGALSVLRLSNAATRVVPLALQLAAVTLFFTAVRRVAALPVAVVATAAVAFHPVAIEYSRTAKQYSGEIAASAALLAAGSAYLAAQSARMFRWLCVALAVAMPLSYPAVFLVPGVVWAAAKLRQTSMLALSAAIMAAQYIMLIRPNYSPALRAFWAVSPEHFWTAGLIAAILLCAGALVRFRRNHVAWMSALPCLLLAASSALGWYPATPRTWLFALPCFALLLALPANELLTRWPRFAAVAWVAAGVLPAAAAWREVHQHRNLPEEDFAGAVRYLRGHAAPSDLLLVHPSVKEGFELYAPIEGFTQPEPIYGATGWPCCVRDHLAAPHSSTRQAVIDDLEAKIPKGYSGRVWLMYSSRPTQWEYTGLDEGNLWRSQAWAMGCPPEPFIAFTNVALSPMVCRTR
jgi:hypothetical protein